MMITVCPRSKRSFNEFISAFISWKCKTVVDPLKTITVVTFSLLLRKKERLIRWFLPTGRVDDVSHNLI